MSPLMRPNWRRCEATTRSGELCMNKAQTKKGDTLVCTVHARDAKPAPKDTGGNTRRRG